MTTLQKLELQWRDAGTDLYDAAKIMMRQRHNLTEALWGNLQSAVIRVDAARQAFELEKQIFYQPNRELGPVEQSQRGFEFIEFEDFYKAKCSLQASSIICDIPGGMDNSGTSAVWLGVDDAQPRIMTKDAHKFGMYAVGEGWMPYPLPDEVLLTTRMHLNREQVAALIASLQRWLDNGSFQPTEESVVKE